VTSISLSVVADVLEHRQLREAQVEADVAGEASDRRVVCGWRAWRWNAGPENSFHLDSISNKFRIAQFHCCTAQKIIQTNILENDYFSSIFNSSI
jgi:hypothetical protein